MPNVVDGLERRAGIVKAGEPVQLHEHEHGHWLTACGPECLMADTEALGTLRLFAGDSVFVSAKDKHRLWVEYGFAKYTCVGRAPL